MYSKSAGLLHALNPIPQRLSVLIIRYTSFCNFYIFYCIIYKTHTHIGFVFLMGSYSWLEV